MNYVSLVVVIPCTIRYDLRWTFGKNSLELNRTNEGLLALYSRENGKEMINGVANRTKVDLLFVKDVFLPLQIWRALRLVVDTGIHTKGLTRDEALELFDKYAWDTTDIAKKEVTRYQSVFGQATAYTIGQLWISQLREKARVKLGNKFNLKEFHYQLLSQGSSPLSYLASHIVKYVQCKIQESLDGCDLILSPPKIQPSPEEHRNVAGLRAKPSLPQLHRRHYT